MDYICHKCLLIFFCDKEENNHRCPNCTYEKNFNKKQEEFNSLYGFKNLIYANYIFFTKKYL